MRPGIAEADDVGHGVAVHIGERARIAVEADPAGVLAELLNRELQRRNPAFRGEWGFFVAHAPRNDGPARHRSRSVHARSIFAMKRSGKFS